MRAAHTLACPIVHQLARMEIPAYQGCKNKYLYLARVHKGPTMVHAYSCHLEQVKTNNTRHTNRTKKLVHNMHLIGQELGQPKCS